MTILLIYRAPRFSPNSVEKDKAILEAVGQNLLLQGVDVQFVEEEKLMDCFNFDAILSMGRLTPTLVRLAEAEQKGIPVINSAQAILRSSRGEIDLLMRANAIPVPRLWEDSATSGSFCGYWAKRADLAAQSREDVQYAADEKELRLVLATFNARGVGQVLVTEHVSGDLVKFYGVFGTGFFRVFYPTDDGDTKFGDERRNGQAHHYAFDLQRLQRDAEMLSRLTGISIYGSDCIVRPDGSYAFIDFNDWPSFSRCREDAARAIVQCCLRQASSSPST